MLDDLTHGEMENLFRLQAKEGMFFPPELDEVLSEFFLNWVSDRGGLGESARSWGNGLAVERHELTFYGCCQSCLAKGESQVSTRELACV